MVLKCKEVRFKHAAEAGRWRILKVVQKRGGGGLFKMIQKRGGVRFKGGAEMAKGLCLTVVQKRGGVRFKSGAKAKRGNYF